MTWLAMPLVPVALAFAAGIALAPWTRADVGWAVWAAALAAGFVTLAFGRSDRALRSATASLLAGVAAIGAVRGTAPPLPPDHVGRLALPRGAMVEGRVAAEPVRYAPERLRVWLDADRVDESPRSGRIQLTVYGPGAAFTPGQRIAAECRLHPAGGFRNPGVFDYGAHLRREGIHVVGTTRAERLVLLEDPGPAWGTRVRRRALEAIGSALPPASAALLGGLLLGDRTTLPREIDEAFRRSGVYHVLAVSGFNVALLAAAVFALLALARVGRRASAVVAIVVVVGFAQVVGPEPSVVRAVIMAVLVLAALLLGREAAVVNSLALAALLVLAVRPGDLEDPGFQLSFAATAGIVVAPLPRGLVGSALAVSAVAQLTVLPITLTHFNQLSTIGVLVNLGVVPLAAVATVVGLLGVTLSFVSGTVAQVTLDAVWPVLLLLRAIVALAASIPGAILHLPAPGPAALALYAGALVAGVVAWGLRRDRPRRARALGGAAATALVAALALAAWPLMRPADGRLRVTVLDVGQGDAIVVEAPDGGTLLIDAGGGGPMRLDAGERVVAPFLWNQGILTLAGVVTTHLDADHAGGAAAVRRVFTVDEGWNPESLAAGPRSLAGVTISLLPTSGTGASPKSRNDAAVVLRIEYGLASFLLASDIGAATERALGAAGAPLASTVLKVAHHGSKTSSTPEFLAAVAPAVAVISVGARNPYRHPDAGVLDRLAAGGARIYRTDRDGAVIFETDGRALTITRWASRTVDRYCLEPEDDCYNPGRAAR